MVSDPNVELSNEAFVYVHGVCNDLQTQVTHGALSNGSKMWLGKLDLGKAFCCKLARLRFTRTFVAGVPAVVDRIDSQARKAFARMQGHYMGRSCSFESKDLMDFNFDEIYAGREVRPRPPDCVGSPHVFNSCMSFPPKMSKFKSPMTSALPFSASRCSQNVGFQGY